MKIANFSIFEQKLQVYPPMSIWHHQYLFAPSWNFFKGNCLYSLYFPPGDGKTEGPLGLVSMRLPFFSWIDVLVSRILFFLFFWLVLHFHPHTLLLIHSNLTLRPSIIYFVLHFLYLTGFANFIDERSQCGFCFTDFGVIVEYLKSSIRLSSPWSWHVYTIVRDTRSSCGGPLTWKAQIHDGGHRVNFDRNLPSSSFVVQYNSLISMI